MKEHIAIVGGGLMGLGIASVFCRNDHKVSLCEPVADQRATLHPRLEALLHDDGFDTAKARYLNVVDRLEALPNDVTIVFEAGPEKLAIKQAIFQQLVQIMPEKTLLASNTSVIPITDIAMGVPLAQRHRILGTHWWNPANLIPLVEVIRTEYVRTETLEQAAALLTKVGKKPVFVEKDVTGFIGNRLQHALWREAQALISAGVCSPETIDIVVKNSFGLRLPVFGPIENADMVGLDLTLDIHNVVLRDLSQATEPLPALVECVAQNKLGAKTGQGFLSWNEQKKQQLQQHLNTHIKNMLKQQGGHHDQ
ncbi:MAG: hypothetical protein KBC57_05165 [Neisseriaceae bacterium]|nr:hypothetical protein [Neisseriaceae bacterium]